VLLGLASIFTANTACLIENIMLMIPLCLSITINNSVVYLAFFVLGEERCVEYIAPVLKKGLTATLSHTELLPFYKIGPIYTVSL
jgi:hypothetical protein